VRDVELVGAATESQRRLAKIVCRLVQLVQIARQHPIAQSGTIGVPSIGAADIDEDHYE